MLHDEAVYAGAGVLLADWLLWDLPILSILVLLSGVIPLWSGVDRRIGYLSTAENDGA